MSLWLSLAMAGTLRDEIFWDPRAELADPGFGNCMQTVSATAPSVRDALTIRALIERYDRCVTPARTEDDQLQALGRWLDGRETAAREVTQRFVLSVQQQDIFGPIPVPPELVDALWELDAIKRERNLLTRRQEAVRALYSDYSLVLVPLAGELRRLVDEACSITQPEETGVTIAMCRQTGLRLDD